MSKGIEERRSFAWRCAEDDSGFALGKMDEIVADLLQRVEELEQERLGLIMEIQRLKDKLKEQDERIAEIRKGAEF
jgi:hypothetical protein